MGAPAVEDAATGRTSSVLLRRAFGQARLDSVDHLAGLAIAEAGTEGTLVCVASIHLLLSSLKLTTQEPVPGV